ncbi:hypothetical protein PR001_g23587 [Phytophthora rubi]|uniref:Uncharacterized protein n=1 Tax=Phytophthora rubi TaxID=129364 RepID=A0A6A3ILJ0_9STRA|nr:hypothetical protein PR001_g23587 [Phytophthora rubi]
MDVRDAIRQDVFSKVYDFREFVDATSGAADVRRCGEGGTREQDVGRAREAVGRGRGEGETCEQDVMKQSTKEEDLLNATVEEKGLVKSRMKAHTRHRPTCRQCEAGHGEGQLEYGVDVNPTVCGTV